MKKGACSLPKEPTSKPPPLLFATNTHLVLLEAVQAPVVQALVDLRALGRDSTIGRTVCRVRPRGGPMEEPRVLRVHTACHGVRTIWNLLWVRTCCFRRNWVVGRSQNPWISPSWAIFVNSREFVVGADADDAGTTEILTAHVDRALQRNSHMAHQLSPPMAGDYLLQGGLPPDISVVL